jgi:DNA-binding FadR family transcriptional regulator
MARQYEEVMEELVHAVVSGEYAEGARLPSEPRLGERFGSGRGVIREAVRGMEERGLVTVRAGRGQVILQREHWDSRNPDVFLALVKHGPDPEVLADAIDARAVIEREVAVRVCRQATDADLRLLRERVDEMAAAYTTGRRTFDATDPLTVADAAFHDLLCRLSGNAMLAKLIEPLHLPLAEIRRIRAAARDRAFIMHHRRILEGVSSREPELAEAAVTGYARQLARWVGVRR